MQWLSENWFSCWWRSVSRSISSATAVMAATAAAGATTRKEAADTGIDVGKRSFTMNLKTAGAER